MRSGYPGDFLNYIQSQFKDKVTKNLNSKQFKAYLNEAGPLSLFQQMDLALKLRLQELTILDN